MRFSQSRSTRFTLSNWNHIFKDKRQQQNTTNVDDYSILSQQKKKKKHYMSTLQRKRLFDTARREKTKWKEIVLSIYKLTVVSNWVHLYWTPGIISILCIYSLR